MQQHPETIIQSLRDTLAKMETVLAHTKEAIVWTNKNQVIQWCNAGFDKLLSMPHIQVLGKKISDLLPEIYHHGNLSNPFQLEEDVYDEYYLQHSDSRQYLKIFGKKLADNDTLIFVITDITRRKKLEQHIVQHEKVASIGQLSAGIAHEINTPLAILIQNTNDLLESICYIAGFLDKFEELISGMVDNKNKDAKTTELLNDFLSSDAQNNMFDEIKLALDDLSYLPQNNQELLSRVKTIIANLQKFSHVDQEQPAETSINTLIQEAIKIASCATDNAGSIHFTPLAEDININCYPLQLEQALGAVILNSCQAINKAQGEVNIKVNADKEDFAITVSDNGSGIAVEHLNKVFDPFFTTKSPGEGTGLGLSMALGIIQRHGGEIELESISQHGTVAHISLRPNDSN